MQEVSIVRLYTLRLAYLILAAGLGAFIWPSVVSHTPEFALTSGVRFSLLAGLGLTAALGLRYPVKMIPLLLFEFCWKIIFLLGFALPLWRTHGITSDMADDVRACLMVVIFVPMIPWGYVVRKYVLAPGNRWTAGKPEF